MNTLKTWIKKANIHTFIWWVAIVFIAFIYPFYMIYSGTLSCNGEEIVSKPWWFYIVGIVIWDLFLLITSIIMTTVIMIFGKIGQWVYESKEK